MSMSLIKKAAKKKPFKKNKSGHPRIVQLETGQNKHWPLAKGNPDKTLYEEKGPGPH